MDINYDEGGMGVTPVVFASDVYGMQTNLCFGSEQVSVIHR